MVVPSLVAPAARTAIRDTVGDTTIVEVPSVGSEVAADPKEGDLLVHSVPDVLGRILPPLPGWAALSVVDRASGVVVEGDGIEYGMPRRKPALKDS